MPDMPLPMRMYAFSSRRWCKVLVPVSFLYIIQVGLIFFFVSYKLNYFENGKVCVCSVKESHQVAEASQLKNDAMKAALGISEYFKEGSSFDSERKAKEDQAKTLAMTQKQYR